MAIKITEKSLTYLFCYTMSHLAFKAEVIWGLILCPAVLQFKT